VFGQFLAPQVLARSLVRVHAGRAACQFHERRLTSELLAKQLAHEVELIIGDQTKMRDIRSRSFYVALRARIELISRPFIARRESLILEAGSAKPSRRLPSL